MTHRARILGLLSLALVVPVLTGTSAQAEVPRPKTSDFRIVVVQHNTDMLGVGPATEAAVDHKADAITFQELCKSRVNALEKAGYHVFWSQTRARVEGRKNKSCTKGNAVASPHELGATSEDTVFEGGGRTFKLVCAELLETGVNGSVVCTTHFPLDYNNKKKKNGEVIQVPPSGTDNRVTMANAVRDLLATRIDSGQRVVLTGDFNDDPASRPLSRFYKAKGSGRFWEGDQTQLCTNPCRKMAPTTSNNKKIDYFFASEPNVDAKRGLTKQVAPKYDREGHYVVIGKATFLPFVETA